MCKVFASTQDVRADGGCIGPELACDTDTVNVFGDDPLPLDYFVELGSSAMQDDGVESNTIQEADTEGQLIQLVEDGTSNFDDGELGRLG